MARVELVASTSATPEQISAYEEVAAQRGDVGNLFRAMLNAPDLTRRVVAVGSALRFESRLGDRLREGIILAMSGRWQCLYQRLDHESIARMLGFSESALADFGHELVPAELSELERAAVSYVLALSHDGKAQPSLLDALSTHLDDRQLVELHLLAGYYSMLAMFLNGLEIPANERPSLPPTGR